MHNEVTYRVDASRESFVGEVDRRDLHNFIFDHVSQLEVLQQDLQAAAKRDPGEDKVHRLVAGNTRIVESKLFNDDRNLMLLSDKLNAVHQRSVHKVQRRLIVEGRDDLFLSRAGFVEVDRGPLLSSFSECFPDFRSRPSHRRFIRERNVRSFDLFENIQEPVGSQVSQVVRCVKLTGRFRAESCCRCDAVAGSQFDGLIGDSFRFQIRWRVTFRRVDKQSTNAIDHSLHPVIIQLNLLDEPCLSFYRSSSFLSSQFLHFQDFLLTFDVGQHAVDPFGKIDANVRVRVGRGIHRGEDSFQNRYRSVGIVLRDNSSQLDSSGDFQLQSLRLDFAQLFLSVQQTLRRTLRKRVSRSGSAGWRLVADLQKASCLTIAGIQLIECLANLVSLLRVPVQQRGITQFRQLSHSSPEVALSQCKESFSGERGVDLFVLHTLCEGGQKCVVAVGFRRGSLPLVLRAGTTQDNRRWDIAFAEVNGCPVRANRQSGFRKDTCRSSVDRRWVKHVRSGSKSQSSTNRIRLVRNVVHQDGSAGPVGERAEQPHILLRPHGKAVHRNASRAELVDRFLHLVRLDQTRAADTVTNVNNGRGVGFGRGFKSSTQGGFQISGSQRSTTRQAFSCREEIVAVRSRKVRRQFVRPNVNREKADAIFSAERIDEAVQNAHRLPAMLTRLAGRRVKKHDVIVSSVSNPGLSWSQQDGLVVLTRFALILNNPRGFDFYGSGRTGYLSARDTRKCD